VPTPAVYTGLLGLPSCGFFLGIPMEAREEAGRKALNTQKDATDLVQSEVEEHRDQTQIKIREMFAGLRLAVKRRQRHMQRRAQVIVDLKRERLTAEFEHLDATSDASEALMDSPDPDALVQFLKVRVNSCVQHAPARN
jgi:hypothetical protein